MIAGTSGASICVGYLPKRAPHVAKARFEPKLPKDPPKHIHIRACRMGLGNTLGL